MRFSTRVLIGTLVAGIALSIAGCSDTGEAPQAAAEGPSAAPDPGAPPATSAVPVAPSEAPAPADRQPLFGAVHVHTGYSFDAFTNGTVSRPADAYAWARGEPIQGNGAGLMIQLRTPLDFYAVSDHAEMMGVFPLMEDPESPLSQHPMAERVLSDDSNVAMQAFAEILRDFSSGKVDPAFTDPAISRSVWKDIVETADAHYEPGTFTTFPAFEWTSNPEMQNLHRVVVFRDSATVPELAYSSIDSNKPEDLWNWMELQRAAGSTLLAIPHNANASDGLMFSLENSQGQPLDAAYAATRSENEPLYEITQIKGTSETHPELSPNDEFAGFELWDYTLSADSLRPTHREGSYARKALLDGLAQQSLGAGNPFQFGFIGDTDTHNAAASNEEDNYTGKFAFETEPAHRLNGIGGQPEAQKQQVREFSSGGLAGVWADANDRESIYDAMLRKETFGTTGSHIRVRLFGGWELEEADLDATDWAAAGYEGGVPMGGELVAAGEQAPTFLVQALKDPTGANLDRIQIVKGWVDAEGAQHETIHDVAWSDERLPDATTGALPAVGDTVDATTASYTNTIGDAELSAAWTDADFDPAEHAFYYARVLEIPTPRWSTRDAVALGVPIPGGLPVSIQERAWSSPIWISPPPE